MQAHPFKGLAQFKQMCGICPDEGKLLDTLEIARRTLFCEVADNHALLASESRCEGAGSSETRGEL
jgi:hypothetical protein